MPLSGAAGRFVRRLRPGQRDPSEPVEAPPAPAAVTPAPTPAPPAPKHTPPQRPQLGELEAEANYAHERVTLARRRALLGRGRPNRLAELERIAEGADQRLRDAKRP